VTVELGVAEQCRTLAVLAHLRRLALRVELLIAHEARAARDGERNHDPIARAHVLHLRTHFHDPAHRLVAQYVARLHEHGQGPVQVKI
jgi:hypothetical protein